MPCASSPPTSAASFGSRRALHPRRSVSPADRLGGRGGAGILLPRMATSAQTLSCPGCGAPMEASAGADVARCGYCHAVVRLPGPPGASAPRPRPPVPMPRGLRVEGTVTGFRIVRRWFSPVFVFLAFFAAFWCGILLIGYGVMFATGAPVFVLLFPVLHVAVGLGLAYYTLCGFLNSTTVETDGSRLSIHHRPMPWPGNLDFGAGDLAQVYVKEKVSRRSDGTSSSTYDVLAVTRGGKGLKLLSGLTDLDQGLFVEQEIERRLGIEDRPVAGEVPRA